MPYPIKFSSLPKAELVYEVLVRNEIPASTVAAMRKQIVPLALSCPSEDILISPLDISEDLKGIDETLSKVKLILEAAHNPYTLMKAENLLAHLYHRLGRLDVSELGDCNDVYEGCLEQFNSFCSIANKLMLAHKPPLQSSSSCVDQSSSSGIEQTSSKVGQSSSSSTDQSSSSSNPTNIVVHCDHNSLNDLNKIKYDGKTCVRTFIQRLTEHCTIHRISDAKILSLALQIFIGDALIWYRSVCSGVSEWCEVLEYLRRDFDIPNFDYKLQKEIQNRTQGEGESIVIYLAVMDGMFNRLTSPPDEKSKLEILLHNVRPVYASILAASEITSINQLRSVCRNFEDVQSRLHTFHEPPKVSSDTVAPDLAYSTKTSFKQHHYHNLPNHSNHNNSNRQFFNNKSNFNRFSSTQHHHRPSTHFAPSHIERKTSHYPQQDGFSQQHNLSQFNKKFNNNYNHLNIQAVSNGLSNSNVYCQRCKSFSHSYANCHRNRNVIFCFGCGKQDVKRPECTKCSPKSKPSPINGNNISKNSKN